MIKSVIALSADVCSCHAQCNSIWGPWRWVQWCIAVPGLVLNTAWSWSTAGCTSVHAAAISILDLSYNVLQWTVMTTTFLRVSKLKYFLWVFIKYFPCVNTGNVLLELNIFTCWICLFSQDSNFKILKSNQEIMLSDVCILWTNVKQRTNIKNFVEWICFAEKP